MVYTFKGLWRIRCEFPEVVENKSQAHAVRPRGEFKKEEGNQSCWCWNSHVMDVVKLIWKNTRTYGLVASLLLVSDTAETRQRPTRQRRGAGSFVLLASRWCNHLPQVFSSKHGDVACFSLSTERNIIWGAERGFMLIPAYHHACSFCRQASWTRHSSKAAVFIQQTKYL